MKLDYSEDIVKKLIDEMLSSGLPTVLFGFGGSVFRMYDHLCSLGLEIKYIVDNNPNKWNETWGRASVISFDNLKRIYSNCNIIITVSSPEYVEQIRKQIKDDGQYKRVYFFQLYYPFGLEAKQMIIENIKKIDFVYGLLADEESKKCFENKLNYILTKKETYLMCNSSEREYFPRDIFDFSESEYFVDAGAFHGEDTKELMKMIKNTRALCIEPDKQNFEKLKKELENEKGIELENAAIWEKNGSITFAESGSMGSTISDRGTVSVKCISLDQKKLKGVTFVKMDVEGAEMEAIAGAKEIIGRDLPKLAICVYHKVEHHWEIPILINKINKNYKIYMRQHDQTGIETVCYAKI